MHQPLSRHMHEEFVTYQKGEKRRKQNFERYVTYSGIKWKNVELNNIDIMRNYIWISQRKRVKLAKPLCSLDEVDNVQ